MRVHPNRAAKLPCLDGPHLKIKSTKSATGNHSIPYTPNAIFNRRIHRASRLTLSDCGSRKDSAKAVVDSTPGDPSLQGHAAPAVVLPKGDSHPAARPVTTHVMDALTHMALVRRYTVPRCPAATYPLGRILRQPVPVSFFWKETGTSITAAALIAHGFAAFPFVTIGVTNADVTSNSHVDDGAASQGMDCT